jgi:hypothetical protein
MMERTMNRQSIDREGSIRSAAARTLVATAFVAGFVALVWAHVDLETGAVPILEPTIPAASCAANDCLHVPAGDPSVPAADRVFVPGGAQEFAPPVPTF